MTERRQCIVCRKRFVPRAFNQVSCGGRPCLLERMRQRQAKAREEDREGYNKRMRDYMWLRRLDPAFKEQERARQRQSRRRWQDRRLARHRQGLTA